MAWLKVDDGFHDHPKVDELSLEAVGLWLLCATWCSRHLTDGEIPGNRVKKFGGTFALCSELVRANMWRTNGELRDECSANTFNFVNWDDWNPTKNTVEGERKKARDRMKRLRQGSDQAIRSPERTANERRSSEDVRDPVPSRPVPSIGQTKKNHQMPKDWAPNEANIARAKKLGVNIDFEAEQFTNHHLSKGSTFKDWHRAFSTWLGNSTKFSGGATGGQAQQQASLWTKEGPF